jgi:hypothetical protein
MTDLAPATVTTLRPATVRAAARVGPIRCTSRRPGVVRVHRKAAARAAVEV